MPADKDRTFMLRALELAKQGMGLTSPNPMVGCVLVRNDNIIAEGWHSAAGQPHAEAIALAAAGENAAGATAYVTLEPCSHEGRTPPCADALLRAGVSEVVYALSDPNPLAAGGGARLANAGVKTRQGICHEEASELNRMWLYAQTKKRPYIIAKFAMSLDGKVATRSGASKWITGLEARKKTHELRRSVDAIIVGAGTVVADDPILTARSDALPDAFPLRVILDSTGRTPLNAAALRPTGKGALVVMSKAASQAQVEAFACRGIDTVVLGQDDNGRPNVTGLLKALKERGCASALIEGGPSVLGSFFDSGLVNEVWAFIAPIIIGGGKSAVEGKGVADIGKALKLINPQSEQLGRDFLICGRSAPEEK